MQIFRLNATPGMFAPRGELTVTGDQHNFYVVGSIAAFDQDQEVFTRNWDVKVPRTVY